MSKIFVDQVDPKTATTLTLGTTGDTVDIPSGVTLDATGATITGALTNTPVFRSYMSGNQSISSATATKVSLDTTTFDSGGDFDTTNNRFVVPSGGAGKYFFYSQIRTSIVPESLTFVYFYVDGVGDGGYLRFTQTNQGSNQISTVLDLADAAYVEVFFYDNGTSPQIYSDADNYSYFTGYKLIG
jgi:hypothetical protein